MRPFFITSALSVVTAFVVLLGGCTSGLNPQQYAGLSDVNVKWCQTGTDYKLCSLGFTDGKGRGNTSVDVSFPDGARVVYTTDNEAVDTQKLRADVEKALIEQLGTATPKVVSAVTTAVLASIGISAASEATQAIGGAVIRSNTGQ